MLFNQTTTYAIRAIAYLARQPDNRFIGANEIAEEVGAPANYLGKTLQIYVRNGILQARRGKTGGLRLVANPEETTLWDLLEPLQELKVLDACPLGNEVCSNERACGIHTRWSAIKSLYSDMLRSTTLDSIGRGELL
jgi:Rrf2 family protein